MLIGSDSGPNAVSPHCLGSVRDIVKQCGVPPSLILDPNHLLYRLLSFTTFKYSGMLLPATLLALLSYFEPLHVLASPSTTSASERLVQTGSVQRVLEHEPVRDTDCRHPVSTYSTYSADDYVG